MPSAAIASGCVDLDYLKRSRGFNFSGYKQPSLMRRIQKRMQTVKISSFPDYIDYLEVHPDEFFFLFNTILINVTGFFRDPAAWEFLKLQVIPRITLKKSSGGPIRVWSCGCASGDEAYSAAILLAEALGEDEFHERVKIYATDVDEDALNFALNDNGFLFLGKAETLLTHSNYFSAVDLKMRVFSKVPKANLRDSLLTMVNRGNQDGVNNLVTQIRLRDVDFNLGTAAQMVIDGDNNLSLANNLARSLFNIKIKDFGRPFQHAGRCGRPG